MVKFYRSIYIFFNFSIKPEKKSPRNSIPEKKANSVSVSPKGSDMEIEYFFFFMPLFDISKFNFNSSKFWKPLEGEQINNRTLVINNNLNFRF